MKRLAVPAEVEAGGAVKMDIGVLEGRAGRASAPDAADLTARVVVVALFTLLAIRIAGDFLETGRLTGLLLLASETLVVILTVMRRSSSIIDRSPRARVLTAVSMMGPFLVRPAAVTALAPETATVLLSAVGLTVVIAGNQPAQAKAALEAMALPVDAIFTSAEWGVEKPDQAFYRKVAQVCGVDAAHILYVGDRLDNDVLAAARAGMRTALLRRGPWGYLHAQRPQAAQADLIAGDLFEVVDKVVSL